MFNLRGCTLGQCLTDAIDEMDQQGLVTSQLRDQILQQFDKSVAKAFEEKVRVKGTSKGECVIFKYVDSVWQFFILKPVFKFGGEPIMCDDIKIIATDEKMVLDRK